MEEGNTPPSAATRAESSMRAVARKEEEEEEEEAEAEAGAAVPEGDKGAACEEEKGCCCREVLNAALYSLSRPAP